MSGGCLSDSSLFCVPPHCQTPRSLLKPSSFTMTAATWREWCSHLDILPNHTHHPSLGNEHDISHSLSLGLWIFHQKNNRKWEHGQHRGDKQRIMSLHLIRPCTFLKRQYYFGEVWNCHKWIPWQNATEELPIWVEAVKTEQLFPSDLWLQEAFSHIVLL